MNVYGGIDRTNYIWLEKPDREGIEELVWYAVQNTKQDYQNKTYVILADDAARNFVDEFLEFPSSYDA